MAAKSVLSSTITCFRKRFKLNSHKKTTHPRFILISAPHFILISAPRFILISAPRFILISAPRFILISVPSIRSVPHPYPRFILTITISAKKNKESKESGDIIIISHLVSGDREVKTVDCNTTGTLTQYKSSING